MNLDHIDSPNYRDAIDYANGVVKGIIIANRDCILGCQRFLNDLERNDLDFWQEQFDFVVDYIEGSIHNVQGETVDGQSMKNKPIKLMHWQKFIIVNLFGFFKKGTMIRRFNEALIFLPRKQGKTAFSSSLAQAKGVLDRMSGSKTYIVANSLKQTMESFKFIADNVEGLRDDVADLRVRDNNQEHSIYIDFGDGGTSEMFAIANQEDKLDSLNGNCLILDELHSWKRAGAKKYTLMKNAMKVYRNKLLLGISTAGDIPNGFLANRLKTLRGVLNGTIKDKAYDAYFTYIRCADQDEDGNILNAKGEITTMDDPEVLAMCTPSLGVTTTLADLEDDAAQAVNEPQLKLEYLNKTLNIFTNDVNAYFKIEEFQASDKLYDWTIAELAKLPIKWYGGADLSKLHDLTAAALYGHYEGPYNGQEVDVDIVVPHAFFPRLQAVQKADEDGIPLFGWAEDGWLTMSNTPTVQHDDIVRWFIEMRDQGFKVAKVGFDKKFGREFFLRMHKARFNIVDQPQYFYRKSEGFRHIEVREKNKALYYCHAEPFEYCVQNIKAVEKTDDQIWYDKLDGDGGHMRIDLFDAAVFACCQMLESLTNGGIAESWIQRKEVKR